MGVRKLERWMDFLVLGEFTGLVRDELYGVEQVL